MKTNIQIKDEPIEIPNYPTKTVNDLLHLYGYDPKDSLVNQEQESLICAWCQKLGRQSFTLHTDNGDSKSLCSEVCFNQYRRASFKKTKDSKLSKIHSTIKIKSTNCTIAEKKSKSIINQTEHNHHPDINRQKILTSYHHSIPTKSKANGFSRNLSPSSFLPLSKHHQSSSSTSSNHPINLNYSPSFILPQPPIEINRFQYPFFTPPPPPPHPIRQISLSSSEHLPSTLSSTLTKGLSSNYTCILPTFIPLPIPIPICLPINIPCVKCSTNVINQECQTEISNQRTRRISI